MTSTDYPWSVTEKRGWNASDVCHSGGVSQLCLCARWCVCVSRLCLCVIVMVCSGPRLEQESYPSGHVPQHVLRDTGRQALPVPMLMFISLRWFLCLLLCFCCFFSCVHMHMSCTYSSPVFETRKYSRCHSHSSINSPAHASTHVLMYLGRVAVAQIDDIAKELKQNHTLFGLHLHNTGELWMAWCGSWRGLLMIWW